MKTIQNTYKSFNIFLKDKYKYFILHIINYFFSILMNKGELMKEMI